MRTFKRFQYSTLAFSTPFDFPEVSGNKNPSFSAAP